MIFSPFFWSIYFLLFKMKRKQQKKVGSEEVLVSGTGSGWLGCEHQNYLLRPAEAGRASDHGPWRGHSSRVAFPALSVREQLRRGNLGALVEREHQRGSAAADRSPLWAPQERLQKIPWVGFSALSWPRSV